VQSLHSPLWGERKLAASPGPRRASPTCRTTSPSRRSERHRPEPRSPVEDGSRDRGQAAYSSHPPEPGEAVAGSGGRFGSWTAPVRSNATSLQSTCTRPG
jgi:hypothetical protein